MASPARAPRLRHRRLVCLAVGGRYSLIALDVHSHPRLASLETIGFDVHHSRSTAEVSWRLPGELARHFQEHRSEEHTSELQSLAYLVCRLLLEKKKKYDC